MDGMPPPVRELADALIDRLLAADPFTATSLGLREYDALVPDPSRAAEDELAGDPAAFAARAEALPPADPAEAVTVEVVANTCRNRLAALTNRAVEYTVTPIPFEGPPALLAVLARTVLVDPAAASDYLERVRQSAGWLG